MPRIAKVAVKFLPTSEGGRQSPVYLGKGTQGRYMPHLVVHQGDGKYLGVEFIEGPHHAVSPGDDAFATIRFMYESDVNYDALKGGATFDIREGGRTVGTGQVMDILPLTDADSENSNTKPTLGSVIQRLRANEADADDWLYIACPEEELDLDSEADLGATVFDEVSNVDVDPPGFKERGFYETIDADTARDCVRWGDRLAGKEDDAAAADVIRYYLCFDAFPETLHAQFSRDCQGTQPSSDRAFYDRLGPEDLSLTCRSEGCDRGAVAQSALCRRHHFESIQGRPCPFND